MRMCVKESERKSERESEREREREKDMTPTHQQIFAPH